MRKAILLSAVLLLVLTVSADAASSWFGKKINLDPETCDELANIGSDADKPGLDANKSRSDANKQRSDVVVFDHEKGQVAWPAPARLVVPDGGVFVVVVKNTDPTQFDYSIDLIDETGASANVDLKASGEAVQANQIDAICLSWRYRDTFPLYRIKISGRAVATSAAKEKAAARFSSVGFNAETSNRLTETFLRNLPVIDVEEMTSDVQKEQSGVDAPDARARITRATDSLKTELAKSDAPLPFLYPYTFPVWVEAAGPRLEFSTGLGFSDLTNQRFFVKTAADGKKSVERDKRAEDTFRPDLMAFATLSFGLGRVRPGIAGGLGLDGNNGDPRYFLGPSLQLGQKLMISLGVFGAKVDRLPKGQRLGEAPLSTDIAAKLESPDKRFKTGFGISISWFLGKGKTEFQSGLAGQAPRTATSPQAPAAQPSAPTPPAGPTPPGP